VAALTAFKEIMPIRKVLFRVDADVRTGAGHLFRCVTIGRAIASTGCRVYWVCKRLSPEMEAVVPSEVGTLLKIDPWLTWPEEVAWLTRRISLRDATVVLDVTTCYTFEQAADFGNFLDRLRSRCRVVLIDGLAADAILGYISARPHVALVPYVGAVNLPVNRRDNCQWLVGPRYFVLQPEYKKEVSRTHTQPRTARRILITFGGTDPKGSTLLALDAVAGLKVVDLQICTVMGPGFSNDLKEAIVAKAGQLDDTCILEDAPSNLAELIAWCDVAVSASGLTKYELAALGKPSLQLSLNGAHALAMEPFVATGATQHLGVADDITAEDLRLALDRLLHSLKTRNRMQTACLQLMDANGTERVVDTILAGTRL